MRQRALRFLEVIEILAVVALSFGVISFIAQPFEVQGASMTPNFLSGDYLLVDKVSYHFRTPERGEVIVFKNPNNESEFYIKRVIGLPGERIAIDNGQVKIDGKLIKEDYLPPTTELRGEYDFILGADEYFVMGDNRPQSYDSRSWGPIDREKVVGVVRVRFWPPNEFGTLSY